MHGSTNTQIFIIEGGDAWMHIHTDFYYLGAGHMDTRTQRQKDIYHLGGMLGRTQTHRRTDTTDAWTGCVGWWIL